MTCNCSCFGDFVEQRQPDQAIAQIFGNRQIAFAVAELLPHGRTVQRYIVEDGVDSLRLQGGD